MMDKKFTGRKKKFAEDFYKSGAWKACSKSYRDAHPLCEQCLKEGRYTKATVVDHIQPHRGDSELFWNPDNWQALCKPCHDKKTGEFDS